MKKRNKRAVLGVEVATGFVKGLLLLAVIIVAALLAITSLDNSGIFTPNSAAKNASTAILTNTSSGVIDFFNQVPTIFTVLAVVAIILVIAIIIRVVGGSGRGESL